MTQTTAIKITGYAGFLLTLAFLFYFLSRVDISLIYYWQQAIPLAFGEALQYPGDISRLLGERYLELLTQPILGGVATALLVLIVFFSLHIIFRKNKGNPLYFTLLLATLIPYILLFAHYRLPAGLIMMVTTGFLLAAIQSLYSPLNLASRSVYNFITGMVVYLVAGEAGLLVLLQVLIIQIVLSKKYPGLISTLPLFIIPLLYLLFNISYTARYAYLGSFLTSKYDEIPLVLYFSLFSPLMLLLVFAGLNFLISRLALKKLFLISGTGIFIVLIILVCSTLAGINKQDRNVLRIFQAGFRNDGETVIRLAGEQSSIDQLLQFEINRALYQTGHLLDSLFHYPQQFGEEGLFLERNISSRVALHISNFYYDMGFANEARHWATEAQMDLKRHPVVLKNLVMTYIAAGNNDIALKYLRILSDSWLHREWSDQVLEMIENNTTRDNQTIQSFINNNPETDVFEESTNPTRKIMTFYSSNPENKMAFEFLVASYLLQHKIGNVLIHLPGFRHFGYEKLPRAVEEAVLIYLARTNTEALPMAGFTISQETIEEFRDFSELMVSTKNKAEGVKKVSKYRNTYWYYVLISSPYASKKQQ
jgi:hypothetical protein